jgi:hypothetical protein
MLYIGLQWDLSGDEVRATTDPLRAPFTMMRVTPTGWFSLNSI